MKKTANKNSKLVTSSKKAGAITCSQAVSIERSIYGASVHLKECRIYNP